MTTDTRPRRQARNLASSLPLRGDLPMHRFDGLPLPLRHWLHHAALPWSVTSALRIWQRAISDNRGDERAALAALARAEARTLARDARRVWGGDHPACQD